jgi:hypothetical protein
MTIIVDAHQHFWNYGTYQSYWMEAPPYAGDPVYQHSDARFTLTIFCPSYANRPSRCPLARTRNATFMVGALGSSRDFTNIQLARGE